MTAHRGATPATDKSNPRTMITSVWPIAMMPSGAMLLSSVAQLSLVKKALVSKPKKTTMTMRKIAIGPWSLGKRERIDGRRSLLTGSGGPPDTTGGTASVELIRSPPEGLAPV
jgi:hypothetical protein